MGRYSDSDEDRKKKKKSKRKSRSRSSSIDSRTSKSSKHKKSKKTKHKRRSRSKSADRGSRSKRKNSPVRRRSRSRSRSKPKSYRIKSRSPSPKPKSYRTKSPSPYRSRRRSRSRSKSRRKSRSTSRTRSRRSRSRSKTRSPRRRSRSRSPRRRSRSRSRDRSRRERSRSKERIDAWSILAAKAEVKPEKDDPCANIPGFDSMTQSEQAEARLQMALKAAAAAGEKLKEQGVLTASMATSLQEQQQRARAIESIESDSFTPAAFRSSRAQGAAGGDVGATLGLGDLTLSAAPSSELRAKDTENLMHPNLYISSEDKMNNWIQKLTQMRRRKLEGSAMT